MVALISDVDLSEIAPLILDTIPVGITLTDPDGRILYFNRYSAEILDRKPAYIGRDVRRCHNETDSISKIDHILAEFKRGGCSEFYYEATRGGTDFAVTVRPLKRQGRLLGCIHSVVIK